MTCCPECIFIIYSQKDLVKLMNQADLYIHVSDAEIEGISCLEAMACGLVPIISDSKLSATNSFSLTEHSLFTAGDASSLAEKIEYWVDNPSEKVSYSKKYAKKADGMRVENTIQDLVKLYRDALKKQKQDGYPKEDVPCHQEKTQYQKETEKLANPINQIGTPTAKKKQIMRSQFLAVMVLDDGTQTVDPFA